MLTIDADIIISQHYIGFTSFIINIKLSVEIGGSHQVEDTQFKSIGEKWQYF